MLTANQDFFDPVQKKLVILKSEQMGFHEIFGTQ